MKSIAGKVFFTAISVLYPLIVYCGLEFWGLSPRRLSLVLLALAVYHFFVWMQTPSSQDRRKTIVLSVLVLVCALMAFIMDNIVFAKLYPVLVSLCFLAFFAFSLWKPPSVIFRIASLADKSLKNSPSRNAVERYCHQVTVVWCGFFVFNSAVATITVFSGSDKFWSLYNGLISYILMGLIFAAEFVVRKMVQRKMQSYVPVCELELNSRPEGALVSFDADEKNSKTWGDFVRDVSKVRYFIENRENVPWVLHCEDSYFFTVSLLAMLQSGRKALVTANRQEAFIKEIKKPEYGFLTDEPFSGDASCTATLIQDVLQNSDVPEIKFGKFDKTAEMVMYTSGTTGKPKAVFKQFLQFENELLELVKVFGDDWVNRKVYSTVNHHHIYGLLFTALLPIATGLPFRRHRIDFPIELFCLADSAAVVASSPAFLKRLSFESDRPAGFSGFKIAPIIYSSGGPLPEDVARTASQKTGFWPMEIYGSTETGGIAYRQSKNGPVWTPFEVCKMSVAEDGCLNIKSSYILDENGFTTGDLVDLYENGRFLLKGRSDSIVKIEEKRISLPEVEGRLKQTGLVADVRVVPMSGKRQYLAAAIVLNEAGRKQFEGSSKLAINNFFHDFLLKFIENTVSPKKWRYLEELPQNTEGKIRLRDVQALFNLAESPNFKILKFRREPGTWTGKLLFPSTSDYYDGHFPEFKLLPAVAQVDMVLRLARNFLDVPKYIAKIHRTKFASPILPDVPVTVQITYDANSAKVAFSFTSVACAMGNAEKMLSCGSITMIREKTNEAVDAEK